MLAYERRDHLRVDFGVGRKACARHARRYGAERDRIAQKREFYVLFVVELLREPREFVGVHGGQLPLVGGVLVMRIGYNHVHVGYGGAFLKAQVRRAVRFGRFERKVQPQPQFVGAGGREVPIVLLHIRHGGIFGATQQIVFCVVHVVFAFRVHRLQIVRRYFQYARGAIHERRRVGLANKHARFVVHRVAAPIRVTVGVYVVTVIHHALVILLLLGRLGGAARC